MTRSDWAEDASVDQPLLDAPTDRGWAVWTMGTCSIASCIDTPVAAIRRTMRRGRAPYWQPYCEDHARLRGVEKSDGELIWTAEFLAPTPRRYPR
jgi:hypothetical protein